MDKPTFHKILDYAVEKEREAADFYHDLQKKAKFSAFVAMLEELEAMERNHILILEKMRLKDLSDLRIKEVEDLKITDYIPEEEILPDSYHNILLIAMQREDQANLLYRELASRFAEEDAELSRLFQRLADEEASHKLKFEKLYDEYVLKEN